MARVVDRRGSADSNDDKSVGCMQVCAKASLPIVDPATCRLILFLFPQRVESQPSNVGIGPAIYSALTKPTKMKASGASYQNASILSGPAPTNWRGISRGIL